MRDVFSVEGINKDDDEDDAAETEECKSDAAWLNVKSWQPFSYQWAITGLRTHSYCLSCQVVISAEFGPHQKIDAKINQQAKNMSRLFSSCCPGSKIARRDNSWQKQETTPGQWKGSEEILCGIQCSEPCMEWSVAGPGAGEDHKSSTGRKLPMRHSFEEIKLNSNEIRGKHDDKRCRELMTIMIRQQGKSMSSVHVEYIFKLN